MRSVEASQDAGPLALILIVGLLHRSLLVRGVTLRRSIYATNNAVMLLLLAVVTTWALLSSKVFRIPWIALIFAWFWLITFGSSFLRHKSSPSNADRDSLLWRMKCANGPFEWRASVADFWLYSLYASIILLQVSSSFILIHEGHVVEGVLAIAALGLFLSLGLPQNKYIGAKHRHGGDCLRIALPTSHIEGTVYVLPCRGHGFEAVWSPKVHAEHVHTDAQIMELFALMRSGSYPLSEPLIRLRVTMSAFNELIDITKRQIDDLAEWLLMDPASTIASMPIEAVRPENVHLIGRDLMFALAHAEYIVFMRKDSLSPRLRNQLAKLRQAKRSGGLDDTDVGPTIGYQDGLLGYQEAVRYVYSLLNQPVDSAALMPPPISSHHSVALGRRIDSTEDYVASLWTLCLEHSESTFSALYMFCCVWFIEVGNISGFHIFPLRCETRAGDPVAWSIIWRQGWYEALLAQFIASSPMMAMGFIAGLF